MHVLHVPFYDVLLAAFGGGGKISGSVSRKQVAKVCVDALTNPSMQYRTLEVVDAYTVKDELRPFIITIK